MPRPTRPSLLTLAALLALPAAQAAASRVMADGEPLLRVEPAAFAAAAGWAVRDGAVVVKLRDRPEALRLSVER